MVNSLIVSSCMRPNTAIERLCLLQILLLSRSTGYTVKIRLIIGIFTYVIFIFVCVYTFTFTNADACMPDAHLEFRGQAKVSIIAFHLV